nr:hypothetical protein [Tanacetum cinerariifolium]
MLHATLKTGSLVLNIEDVVLALDEVVHPEPTATFESINLQVDDRDEPVDDQPLLQVNSPIADSISEIKSKKLIEAPEEEGWVLAMTEELNQFERNKMDVKSAFLNGKISKEVYVEQPPRFENSEFPNYVCKLNKALYGLELAPKAWYETLSKFLTQHKFIGGFQIKQDSRGISIFQEKYVEDLLKKYDLADCASVKCPMLLPNNLGPDESWVSVNETRYQANPKESHLVAVKRIFRYLKGIPNLGLSYPKGSGFDLNSYSDSDYAGCNLYGKSTSGGCKILGGKLVCWSAKKQTFVTMSSAKAEYVPIFCDNTSAIAISNNPMLHSRTKHIDIRYHFIRDHILKGDIELHIVPTDLQLSDIFTKPLAEPNFTRLVAELGMLNMEKHVFDKKKALRFWYIAEVEEETKTITFLLSWCDEPMSFTQKEFISAIRLPFCKNLIHLPPKETVRAGLATLGLFDNDKPTLSSTVLVNSSPLKIKYFSPIWKLFMQYIVKCLGGMQVSHDQMNLNQQTIVYCLIYGLEIDIEGIIFSDLVHKLQIRKKNMESNIFYTRVILPKKQVDVTHHAEVTVATADTTKSPEASELVEEQGNQPSFAKAKK